MSITIISGPPGAGKTPIAATLVRESRNAKVAHIAGDAFWAFVAKGGVSTSRPEAQPQNAAVIGSIAGTAGVFVQNGFEALVDFVCGPWYLGPFRNAAREAKCQLNYVVLLPTVEQSAARMMSRVRGGVADYSPYRELHLALGNLGELQKHVLDTSQQTFEQTAAAVREGLSKGRYKLS